MYNKCFWFAEFVGAYSSLLPCTLMVADAHELKVNAGLLGLKVFSPSMLRVHTFSEQFKMSDRASDCCFLYVAHNILNASIASPLHD